MEQSAETESFLAQTELIAGGSEKMFLATLGINSMIAGIFALMTMWVHSMQLIIHLPILQVIVPSNVSAYF